MLARLVDFMNQMRLFLVQQMWLRNSFEQDIYGIMSVSLVEHMVASALSHLTTASSLS